MGRRPLMDVLNICEHDNLKEGCLYHCLRCWETCGDHNEYRGCGLFITNDEWWWESGHG
jgi:hypothetical protein